MKTLFVIFFCFATYTVSDAQTIDLIGSWEIIDFSMTSDENSNKMEEEQLKKDGSKWSLFFMDDGKFKQTSNMRTGTMESHEGTWKTLEDILTLELQLNEQTINLNYTFKLKENVLVLNRSMPRGTMKVVCKFRKQ